MFTEKSSDLKLELLFILFEHFDNLTEEKILKINKSKVIKPLLGLLKDKNKEVHAKTEEFLEFLLTFFKKKEINSLVNTSDKLAQDFINKFSQSHFKNT